MKALIISESFIVRDSLEHLLKKNFDIYDINLISRIDDLSIKDISDIDLSFIDINTTSIDILEKLSKIKNKYKTLKIIVLDVKKDRDLFFKVINYGVDGYVLNISDKEEFIYIIKKVLSGKNFYDSELVKYSLQEQKVATKQNIATINCLTNKEKNVLHYVCKGLSNKDIANELKVTDNTIKKHVSNILNKLNLRSRQDIIIYAKENYIDDIIL